MVTNNERVSIMAHWTWRSTVAALISLQSKCIKLSVTCAHFLLFDLFLLFGFVVWWGFFLFLPVCQLEPSRQRNRTRLQFRQVQHQWERPVWRGLMKVHQKLHLLPRLMPSTSPSLSFPWTSSAGCQQPAGSGPPPASSVNIYLDLFKGVPKERCFVSRLGFFFSHSTTGYAKGTGKSARFCGDLAVLGPAAWQ